ncbi:hypothetical protein LARI1_G007932, partial [Lachnellula arida]
MAPSRIDDPLPSFGQKSSQPYKGPPRNIKTINDIKFDDSLQPTTYNILGTHPDSKILFEDVSILDSTGRDPYPGDVLIEGEKIVRVGNVPDKEALKKDHRVRLIHGRGRTLMSGLGDAHTHFTWNGGDLNRLGDLGIEEHVLLTARSAQCYIDSGYTMYVEPSSHPGFFKKGLSRGLNRDSKIDQHRCFGAASAKERLDIVIRDAINAGDIPGPRYLANGKEMARRDGDLVGGITAYADGPEEMREVIRHHVRLGVDNIKLSMSGEEITETRSAQDCYFSDEETAACVDEGHKLGKRLCAHARARDSVTMCIKHGVDVIYHASYIDDEGMDMLEAKKTKHVVAPAINWLIGTLNDAAAFGYPKAQAEQAGYRRELDAA